LGCAHSLGLSECLYSDSPNEWSQPKTQKQVKKNKLFKYLEDYWIQPSFTKNSKGEFTKENRIPLKLYKYHSENDWALFIRADNSFFSSDEIATIDRSSLINPTRVLNHLQAIVLHCPVSLGFSIARAGEFSMSCQISSVHVQGQSSHHVKYEGRDLCRGSSGGGLYITGSKSVLGMHIEAVREADYEDPEQNKRIVHTDKRVRSEDQHYDSFEASDQNPPNKKLKSESETLASIANGNNGLGSAIIICKFPRLLHYIEELEA